MVVHGQWQAFVCLGHMDLQTSFCLGGVAALVTLV